MVVMRERTRFERVRANVKNWRELMRNHALKIEDMQQFSASSDNFSYILQCLKKLFRVFL
jgi:hypothetical protein